VGGCHSLNHNLIHLVSMTTIIILSVEILEAIVDEICLHEPGSMISVQISQMMKLQVICKSIDSQNSCNYVRQPQRLEKRSKSIDRYGLYVLPYPHVRVEIVCLFWE